MLEVTRETEGGMTDQLWRFMASSRADGDGVELRLTEYATRARATKRHKMAITTIWRNYDKRNNTIEAPPVPADVVREAMHQITFTLILPSGEKTTLAQTPP